MAQRVTLRKRQPYNTTSNRRRVVKTPGGKLVVHHLKKKAVSICLLAVWSGSAPEECGIWIVDWCTWLDCDGMGVEDGSFHPEAWMS